MEKEIKIPEKKKEEREEKMIQMMCFIESEPS